MRSAYPGYETAMTEKAIRRTRHWLAFDFLAVSAAEKRRGGWVKTKRCLSAAPQAQSEFFSSHPHRASQGTGRSPAAMFAQRFWVLLTPQKGLAESSRSERAKRF